MPRRDDVKLAFTKAIKCDSAGRMAVNTSDFVKELAKLNHEFSREEANNWIKRYQPSWQDVTSDHGDNHQYLLRNMGYTH